MIKMSRTALALLIAVLPLATGCSVLGGGGKPVTLYQFGSSANPAPTQAAMPLARPIVIAYAGSQFERQSSGDRILTATGGQVAYVSDARWAAPAHEMFDATAIRHIEALSPQLRVVRAGSPVKADYMVAVDVRAFEASYAGGAGAAPEVVILARAKMMRMEDRVLIGDWPIEHHESAGENRISAIVAAFDRGSAAAADQIAGNVRQMLGTG